jgi:hypothetical protein
MKRQTKIFCNGISLRSIQKATNSIPMHMKLSNTSEFALSFQEMLFFSQNNLEGVSQRTHPEIKKIKLQPTQSEKL